NEALEQRGPQGQRRAGAEGEAEHVASCDHVTVLRSWVSGPRGCHRRRRGAGLVAVGPGKRFMEPGEPTTKEARKAIGRERTMGWRSRTDGGCPGAGQPETPSSPWMLCR